MASVLKKKNDTELTPAERRAGKCFQWNPHSGAREQRRNLKRLQPEALREQRAQCDWLMTTATIEAAAPEREA